jgi:hypothetical protein
MALAQQFTAYAEWRDRLSESLVRFRNWLDDNTLCDAQTDQRFTRLFEKLREDRLRVAFVAEFSRGKSELINAIFFARHGNRMLPSSVGRTTMCPTELMYDPDKPPCIDLLPIETRETGTSINDYRRVPDEWYSLLLDVDSPDALQETLRSVSEVRLVSQQTAVRLGFSEEGEHTKADEDGQVEIPRWRHAIINYPHPLLQQGLVILDTPGLNAIGAEPELTLSLLPSAHAILFILAADTGVTQSDLSIWNEHIGGSGHARGRIVVLNKIDGLWDGLKSDAEIADEIGQQIMESAHTLGLSADRVFPVSAQKGLVAKVSDDEALLERSRLPELEYALSHELIPTKQDVMREGTNAEFGDIYGRAHGLLGARLSGLREQIGEMAELRGKNRGVVKYMIGKIQVEKEEFETGLQRFYAVRSVLTRLTNQLFEHLGMDSLRNLAASTRQSIRDARSPRALTEAVQKFLGESRRSLKASEAVISEIVEMLIAIHRKFVIEHGLKLSNPAAFPLTIQLREIDRLERWRASHMGTSFPLLTQEKRQVAQRSFDEIANQVRWLFEILNREAESWIKGLTAPVETQIRERQDQLKRRLESIRRIHQTTDTLEERINELLHGECRVLDQLQDIESSGEHIRRILQMHVVEEISL